MAPLLEEFAFREEFIQPFLIVAADTRPQDEVGAAGYYADGINLEDVHILNGGKDIGFFSLLRRWVEESLSGENHGAGLWLFEVHINGFLCDLAFMFYSIAFVEQKCKIINVDFMII